MCGSTESEEEHVKFLNTPKEEEDTSACLRELEKVQIKCVDPATGED